MNSIKKLEKLLENISEDEARALLNSFHQTERRKVSHDRTMSVGEALGEFRVALSTPTVPQPEPLPCACCGLPLEHVWCPEGYGPTEYQGKWLHPGTHEACLDLQMWHTKQANDDVELAYEQAFEHAVDDSGLAAKRYQTILENAGKARVREDVRTFINGNALFLVLFGLSRKVQRTTATLATYRWLYIQFMKIRTKRTAYILSERFWLAGLKEAMNSTHSTVPSLSTLEDADFVCIYGLGELEHCSSWEMAQISTLLESREASGRKTLIITGIQQQDLAHRRSISRNAYECVMDMAEHASDAA